MPEQGNGHQGRPRDLMRLVYVSSRRGGLTAADLEAIAATRPGPQLRRRADRAAAASGRASTGCSRARGAASSQRMEADHHRPAPPGVDILREEPIDRPALRELELRRPARHSAPPATLRGREDFIRSLGRRLK